ncbi:MAG: hypothetical protein KKB21_01805 [Nanoarchaeota archaeon]|nr:hypothetical protein [Nanoarchaeota archaeon]
MGIQVEFNPDLALRNVSEFKNGNRKEEECIPEDIKEGESYNFLKKGQRNYWLEGEIPLLETRGNNHLSIPVASIIIIESTHFVLNGELWTKGKYKVIEVFDKEDKIHFNGFAKI